MGWLASPWSLDLTYPLVLVRLVPMSYVAPLFGEARERQRRRRRAVALAGLAAAAVAAFAIYASDVLRSAPRSAPGLHEPSGTVAAPASTVFSQAPYMGVRCSVPNSIACDRVGLAIWLKRPAYSATATIDGRPLAMNRFGDRLIDSRTRRTEFDGYLQPAGIVSSMHVRPTAGSNIWSGDPTPFVMVRLLIDYGGGRYVVTHLRVGLSAGWG